MRTSDRIYVAADSLQNESNRSDDGSESESPCDVCKIGRVGKIYLASSGLSRFEHEDKTKISIQELCKETIDPGRTIRDNIHLIEESLYETCLETARYICEKWIEKFDCLERNPVHIALFGIENESPVVSSIRFHALGPDDPGIEVCKRYNVGADSRDPVDYILGCEVLMDKMKRSGALPNIQGDIRLWLERAMRQCVLYQGEPKTIGGEIALLRIESSGEEVWIQRPDICKDT